MQLLSTRWPDAGVNQDDGLRLDWQDRWVHVRPSNTEPIVRVIAEAPRRADAEKMCRAVGELLQKHVIGYGCCRFFVIPTVNLVKSANLGDLGKLLF